MLLNAGRKAYAEATRSSPPKSSASSSRSSAGTRTRTPPGSASASHSSTCRTATTRQALDAVTPAANDANFADRPLALYYAGVMPPRARAEGTRGGRREAERDAAAADRPPTPTSPRPRSSSPQAREAFEKKTPPDAEWAARVAVRHRRDGTAPRKSEGGAATAEPFVKDAALAKSKFRPLGLYYHGFACFLLNDVPAAGKSLNQLAPFDQPFGPHARYLMGRVHEAQRREGRGRRRVRRRPRRVRRAEEGRGRGAQAAGPVQERPVGEGAARSAA